MKTLVSFILFFILFFSNSHVCALQPGDIAKDFALRGTQGDIITFSSLREGAQVVVLEFISIYCDVCKKKAPQLSTLQKKYASEKVKIVAVALANDWPEITSETSSWDIKYPILADPEKITLHLYGFHNVPQVYVIDSSGIIRYSGGADNLKEIEQVIDSLLSGEAFLARPGDTAPEIEIFDYAGKKVQIDFSESAAGTILAFFNADDRNNRRQAVFLEKLSEKKSELPFSIYALIAQPFDGDIEKIIRPCGDRVHVLIDGGSRIFKLYHIEKPPELVIVSNTGRIRKRNAPCDVEQILKFLERPSQPSPETKQEPIENALRRAMPEARMIKPITIGEQVIYVGTHSDGTKSYARVVTKDILCEVCTDVSFVQVIDQEGLYRAFELLRPIETCGKQVDATRFIRQFIGKSYHQPLVAGANVDTISGATKSSLKFIEALNENEAIFSRFIDDPAFDATFRRSVCFLEQAELELAMMLYQREHRKPVRNVQDLASYLPDGMLPNCPSGGTYMITVFNDIPRIICTVHGLDPESSMIH